MAHDYDDEEDYDEEDYGYDLSPLCTSCGRDAGEVPDDCAQCGAALCHMCYELGAGFCEEHPDEHFDPTY